MSLRTNKVNGENVKRKNKQQEGTGHSIPSECFLRYVAVAKLIPTTSHQCITLAGKSVL